MTRPFQLCVLLFIVSTVLPAKPQPRVHPKVTTPAAGASQQWLRKLDRPPANTQVVKGAAPDAQWPVLLELRDGGGALLESRQVFVNPEDMSVVAGFDRLFSADNMIIAYTVRNGTKHFEQSVIVARTEPGAASDSAAGSNPPASHAPSAADSSKRTSARNVTPAAKAAAASRISEKSGGAQSPQTTDNKQPDAPAEAKAAPDPCSITDLKQGIDLKGVNSGNAHLIGTSLVQEGSVSLCVNGTQWKIASVDKPSDMLESLKFTGGKFDLNLQETLATNETLLAIVSADDTPTAYAEVKVKPAIPADVDPQIQTVLVPGVSELKIKAAPTLADGGYEVRIFPCGPLEPGAPVVKWSTANRFWEVTDANGASTITLDQPLYAGQSVKICQEIVDTTDASAPTTGREHPAFALVTDPLDLGHVRYYFTSGVVMSQANGFQTATGTTAALFLGFDVDRAWLKLDNHGLRRLNVNTYFDARLTSVPAQGAATQETSTTAAATTTGENSTSTLSTFTQSRKAASLQAGVYLPWITTRWAHDRYSLFAAPLGKVGFVTLTEDVPSTTTGTTTGNTSTSTTVEPVTGRFYTFHAFGTRLGVYRHFRSRDSAPDLVSYVDITRGRFGSFEAFRQLSTVEETNAQMGELIRARPWRWSFEGLLKIPYSPFVVGFNANIGSGAVAPQSKTVGNQTMLFPFTQPKDDLRFLFGMRFDASKLLRSLPSLQ